MRRTRSCTHACGASSARRPARLRDAGRRAPSPQPDGDAKVAIVSLLAGVDAADRAGAAGQRPAATSKGRARCEARRRSRARRRPAGAGRRGDRRRPHHVASGSRGVERTRHRGARLRRPPGERLRRRRLPRRRRRRLRRAGEALLETGRHLVPADVHHGARGASSSTRSPGVPADLAGPAHPRRASRGPVPRRRGVSARIRRRPAAIPTWRCSRGCSTRDRFG